VRLILERMANNIDLEKMEGKASKIKARLKKNMPALYTVLAIILIYISFFGGAFLHESKLIQKFNIFPVWFGITDVSVDPSFSPVVKDNATIIPFSIKNVGDKDINNLAVTYTFCGLPPKKASLQKNTLYKDEPSGFNLETDILLNTSCQIYTDKVWSDVYLDSKNNCYLDVPQSITNNYCEFCKVQFDIFADGKSIHKELWYPYLGDSFDTTGYIINVLTQNNLTINWAEGYNSTCRVLVPGSAKIGLIKKDKIALTFFDAWTMCERGDDVQWCKENYYNKSRTN